MTFIESDAFTQLVLEDLLRKAGTPGTDTHRVVTRYAENYDDIIYDSLKRGQTHCDTETLALWYSYCYSPMHFDAYQTVISLNKELFDNRIINNGDLLMIDIGCGPMTSAVAIADYYLHKNSESLSLAYVGIDNAKGMIGKAKQFAAREELFYMVQPAEFYNSWNACNINSLKNRISIDGTLLFNWTFHYRTLFCFNRPEDG